MSERAANTTGRQRSDRLTRPATLGRDRHHRHDRRQRCDEVEVDVDDVVATMGTGRSTEEWSFEVDTDAMRAGQRSVRQELQSIAVSIEWSGHEGRLPRRDPVIEQTIGQAVDRSVFARANGAPQIDVVVSVHLKIDETRSEVVERLDIVRDRPEVDRLDRTSERHHARGGVANDPSSGDLHQATRGEVNRTFAKRTIVSARMHHQPGSISYHRCDNLADVGAA